MRPGGAFAYHPVVASYLRTIEQAGYVVTHERKIGMLTGIAAVATTAISAGIGVIQRIAPLLTDLIGGIEKETLQLEEVTAIITELKNELSNAQIDLNLAEAALLRAENDLNEEMDKWRAKRPTPPEEE